MTKRFFALALTLVLILSAVPGAALAAPAEGLANFQRIHSYTAGQYADVPESHTFAANVRTAYELGLMQGYGDGTFGITGNITRLASIIIACRVHVIYSTGTNPIEGQSGTAAEKYLRYARASGIYCDFADTSVPATRAEFARILSSALPDEALASVNTVDPGAIPDVPGGTAYADAIYRLYRAGVLNGSDAQGTFYPGTPISRGAACAIATRMADPALRKSVTLRNTALSAEAIYAQCASAVAYVEVMDKNGFILGSGSGFFLSADGQLVTCYHVIEDAASATVVTNDNKRYAVEGVYDYSAENDWAVLKVSGGGFPYLTPGGSGEYPSGAAVYAIGSPLGLSDTISPGIVSNPARTLWGTTYIQITAPISEGSSGGALISKNGHVIGITAAGFDGGQNLNLAVPITYLDGYRTESVTPLSALPSGAMTRNADVYDYLEYLAYFQSNYILDGAPVHLYEYDEGDLLVIGVDTGNGERVMVANLRELEGGGDAIGYLFIGEDLEPYEFRLEVYPPGADDPDAVGLCMVDPRSFTGDTESLPFLSYEGPARADDQELAAFMLSSLLQSLELVFADEFDDGYSIWDLGFFEMYEWFWY